MTCLSFEITDGELDTFDSFYTDFTVPSTNEISIPWANIGIYEHKLNSLGLDDILYLDKCIVRLEGVRLILKNSQIYYNAILPKEGNYTLVYLGGINIKTNTLDDLEFFCQKATFELSADFRLRPHSWIEDLSFMQKELPDFMATSAFSHPKSGQAGIST